MTSSQKPELVAAEMSLKASFGGGGRMSVAVSSRPNTASKVPTAGGLISSSSMVLLTVGRKRMPVARIGWALVAAKSNRCRKCGANPGCVLRYCTVPTVVQPLDGFEELAVIAAGLVWRVYWMKKVPSARSVQVPPHAASFVSPLSRFHAMLETGIVRLKRSTTVGFRSFVAGDHALAVP